MIRQNEFFNLNDPPRRALCLTVKTPHLCWLRKPYEQRIAPVCPESDRHDFEGRGGESVRGKLRDKRTDARRDRIKRELMQRRRPAKRDNRMFAILSQQFEDEFLLDDEEELQETLKNKK